MTQQHNERDTTMYGIKFNGEWYATAFVTDEEAYEWLDRNTTGKEGFWTVERIEG